MEQEFKRLLTNLDEYIRKYYTDRMIRGFLFLVGLVVSFLLIFALTEHFFYLKPTFKKVVFWFYIALSGLSFIYFLLVPLLSILKILKPMSHMVAAQKIGQKFPEIDDKLLNTLQLYYQRQSIENQNIEFLNASIEQRIFKFKTTRFRTAINLRLNRRYLKYALPPLMVFFAILLSSPSVILNSSKRLLLFDSTFVRQAPFRFELQTDLSNIVEGQSLDIELRLVGETVPADAIILIDGNEYLMRKNGANQFTYRFDNIRNSVSFFFRADIFESQTHSITIGRKPKIIRSQVVLNFPAYIKRKQEIIDNTSEILIPEGTNVSFNFFTQNSKALHFWRINNETSTVMIQDEAKPTKVLFNRLINNDIMRFLPESKDHIPSDTIDFFINVIKDEFPQIKVNEYQDSIFEKRKFFKGGISDDYGFTELLMILEYQTVKAKDTTIKLNIPLNSSENSQDFLHYIDFSEINAKQGSVINYYFKVSDNDGVNGRKSSKSSYFQYFIKTLEQEQEEDDLRDNELQTNISQNSAKADELTRKIEKLQEKIRGKKTLSWEEKKEIDDLLKQFEDLQKKLNQQLEKAVENDAKSEESLKQNEELKAKQEEIRKLMEEILTPEMKLMIDEMKRMLEQNTNADKVQESLEKMKMDSEFLKEQLERELELMTQLKFDQKLQQSIDKLNELSEKQKELGSSEIQKNDTSKTSQQEELNKEFDRFQDLMKETRDLNSDLKEPNQLKDTKEQEKSIEESMEQSLQDMKSNKGKTAQKKQKDAAEKMKDLASELESMQAAMESESQGEDIENLKNILHNLVEVSFNQEHLMEKVKFTNNRDPKFPKFIEEQRRIVSDLQMIEDSLNKLAMRNPSISPMISKELKLIKSHSELAFVDLKEMNTIGPTSSQQVVKSTANQQFIMTSVNNLALMLSEVLNQMQQQQMQQKSGKGSCKKPKPGSGGSANIKTMKEMQQALQKQMERMKQQMQSGGQQKGPKGQNAGGEQMSEEFARMAAQQEALRKMVQEYRDQMAKEGRLKEASNLGEAARQMEQTETELINKTITAESLLRQKEILTRLLESEKSEREREQKEERESKEGKNENNGNKNLILQYKGIFEDDLEILRTVPPGLRPFYKRLVDQYFEN